MTRLLLFLLISFTMHPAFAGGIRGTITGEEGEALAFATIFIRQLNNGTSSNREGSYEIELTPGTYSVTFQYMGYESKTMEVTVGDSYKEINVSLKTQTLVLQDVKIRAGNEDPAYTIMRKAIAKARYHTQFIDHYSARVYIKGTGVLKNAPFFIKGTLKKEGVELDKTFVSESISEIEYLRPNTYKEKVISVRSSGEGEKSGNPNGYINGSFYEPELANSVTPLSPQAFLYYRFEYDGTFEDRGYEVSKIRVIPRSRGDNVFSGYIQIVEGLWSIHSLELDVSKLGIKFDIRQVFAPIQEQVWLPVTHKYRITGKVFGFDFEANYLANVSDYSIELNPELDLDVTVIDEKVDKELAEKLTHSGDESLEQIQEQLNEGKEVTRKQFNKMLKEYEKEERREMDDRDVVYNHSYRVDSGAYVHDSLFWANQRPVPLSKDEVVGYAYTDSLAAVDKQEAEGDTIKSKNYDHFRPWDLLIGNSYKMGEGRFTIEFPQVNYNTVDGANLHYQVNFSRNFKDSARSWLKVSPGVRYNFAREAWNARLEAQYGFGNPDRRSDLTFSGGRYVSQFNDQDPIHPIVNSIFSLFFGDNYMKIYEKDYVRLNYNKKWEKVQLNISTEYARRRFLENFADYSFKDTPRYTTNAPENIALDDNTAFDPHDALIIGTRLEYRPWMKYRIYNGKKYPINDSSPRFRLQYRHGEGDVAFDHIELGYRHSFKIGIQNFVDLAMNTGFFPGDKPEYLMDFKHFPGNKTPFVTADYLENYRLLPYYKYSINDAYFSGYLQYQFRKLLLTRIPMVRLAGIREGFFANYLGTSTSNNYTELGYGINYIFRILRLEAVTSFQNGKYQDWGVRIGIATNLDDIF